MALLSSVPCDIGHYWSDIFSVKTEKMAAECDDFRVIFGIFSQVCYPSLPSNENKHFYRESDQCLH